MEWEDASHSGYSKYQDTTQNPTARRSVHELSFELFPKQATSPAHTSNHSDAAAFAARSPAQLILYKPQFPAALETNPVSINRLTQLAS
jgi:hypothetical protein